MFVGHSSLHALYDGWDWGHGARSCLLLSYGANMCFTFATGFFFTVYTHGTIETSSQYLYCTAIICQEN